MALADKIFFAIFIGIFAALGILSLTMQQAQQGRVSQVVVGSTTIAVEVADSPQEREQGLSNRSSLPEGQGMLFVFEEDGEWGFWMKDTLIPLDMLWASEDGTIVTIAKNVQPNSYPTVYVPKSPARYVLEVPGGYSDAQGIAEGMKIVVQ